MPRPIFAHKLHLTRVGQAAADTSTPSPVSAASERWYGLQEQVNMGTTTAVTFMAALGGNGTASAFIDSTGSYINYLSGTAVSNGAGWANNVTDVVQTRLLPDLLIVMKTGAAASDIASVRILGGLSGSGFGINNDAPGAAGISSLLFRYSTIAGNSTWQASSSNGTSDTAVDTGVAVSVDTRYVFRIKVVSTSSVEYYINGTLVATITTTLPAAATGFNTGFVAINNGAGTGRAIRLRKYYIDAL